MVTQIMAMLRLRNQVPGSAARWRNKPALKLLSTPLFLNARNSLLDDSLSHLQILISLFFEGRSVHEKYVKLNTSHIFFNSTFNKYLVSTLLIQR
jgi:hypothetical protein